MLLITLRYNEGLPFDRSIARLMSQRNEWQVKVIYISTVLRKRLRISLASLLFGHAKHCLVIMEWVEGTLLNDAGIAVWFQQGGAH